MKDNLIWHVKKIISLIQYFLNNLKACQVFANANRQKRNDKKLYTH